MSYTEFNKEVDKWLISRKLPYLTRQNETDEECIFRISSIALGRQAILEKWFAEKLHKELLAIVRIDSGYFDVIASHFVEVKDEVFLKLLYERQIRYMSQDLISLVKHAKEKGFRVKPELINNFKIINYNKMFYNGVEIKKTSNSWLILYETIKFHRLVCKLYDDFLEGLNKISADEEYINLVKNLKNKTMNLTIRKCGMKLIHSKI